MIHSVISIFILTVSTALLIASESNIQRDSDTQIVQPSFPPEPPPELREILPSVTFAELTKIHQNELLSIPQKIMKIDEILNELPENILQQFPLPPIFRLLPREEQEVFKAIRTAKNLTVEEKWLHVALIAESLPEEHKRILQQTLPDFSASAPSPELKHMVPKEAWEQIVFIYQNINLDKAEKMRKIDEIIQTLPGSIRQKLLSPFQKLPAIIQYQLREVHMQHELSVKERFHKFTSIIKSLPMETKKLIFPNKYNVP